MKETKPLQRQIKRRHFLKQTSATGALTGLTIMSGLRAQSPNNKLNIAAIGVGGRGASVISRCTDENIVALCDVDADRGAETFKQFPKAKRFIDFRVMLDKMGNEIDAVIIATPDHTHAVATMDAMQRGKHVYTEKPLTHSIWEARQLTEASRKYKVATQMGNQGHSSEGARQTVEWIRAGVIGEVREVHCWSDRPLRGTRFDGELYWPQGVPYRPADKPPVPDTLDWDLWLGPAPHRPYHPSYVPFDWRGWWDFGTGALGDMGCHIIDHPYWALQLGHPESVEATSSHVSRETAPLASMITYQFPARGDLPPVTMYWYDGGLKPPRPAELEPDEELLVDGCLYIGDKGKMMHKSHGGKPVLIPLSRMEDFKRPPKTIPRLDGHEQNWIDACKGGEPACSNFEYAGPMTEVVLLGNLAIRTSGPLLWDGPNMRVTNNKSANKFIRRAYRKGWAW
ncbi:MAG: Gfo/Idh/MocA family oxidoreductase [Verrucomicrobiaceae bacterium]|nr:Gfo/Idh/MocA family oxidoreductase [Verrucomicrobiaceae bacterium]